MVQWYTDEELAKERNFRLNKPTYEPGQGVDDYSEGFGMSTNDEGEIDWASQYGISSSPEVGSTYTTGVGVGGYSPGATINTGLEGGFSSYSPYAQSGYGMSGIGTGTGFQSSDNRPAKERMEDAAYEFAQNMGKESWNFLKKLQNSRKTQTRRGYREFFSKLYIYGIGALVLSVVFSVVLRLTGWTYAPPTGLFWAGPTVASIGLFRRLSTKYYTDEPEEVGNTELEENKGYSSLTESENYVNPFKDFKGFEEEVSEVEEEVEEMPKPAFDFSSIISEFKSQEENEESKEDEAEGTELNLDRLDNGLYTRKVLVDLMREGLPVHNPNFHEVKELDEDSSEFNGYYAKIKEASDAANVPYDNQPVLETVWESIFTTTLKCRVDTTAQSVSSIATHLESLLRYNDMGQIVNESVQVTGKTVGRNIFFTLVWNKAKLLYQGDLLHNNDVYEAICDTGLSIPVTWGVDEMGNVSTTDLEDVVSMIVSGPPESGKTEFVTRLITQAMWVTSPKELNFLFASPKALEDYGVMKDLPHVKGFETNVVEIVKMLDWVINSEAERRREKINQYGFNNAKRFNKNLPDGEEPLPLLWILLDEMATIQAELPEEQKKEYINKLRVVATQFRSLNIKLMMLPHRITNSMIPKDVYSIADVRAMVRANEDEMKEGIGVTQKDFPYKLNQRGDYALKHKGINGGTAKYMYTPVLTLGDKRVIMDQIKRIWGKLEPDCHAEDWETFSRKGILDKENPKNEVGYNDYTLPVVGKSMVEEPLEYAEVHASLGINGLTSPSDQSTVEDQLGTPAQTVDFTYEGSSESGSLEVKETFVEENLGEGIEDDSKPEGKQSFWDYFN